MTLTDEEIERFNRDGFLIFPNLVRDAEVDVLRAELRRLSERGAQTDPGPKRIATTEESGTLRTVYGFHQAEGARGSKAFSALSRTPRLLGRAQQILGTDRLYMFQSKSNLKSAVDGGIFAWHQDYAHWIMDGVPSAHMVTFLVMLEEATEFSGCLYFIPRSHRFGLLEQEATPTGTPRVKIPKERVLALLRESPPAVPIVGRAGTGVIFHSNIVHASGHNLSAKDRWHVYFVYNPITNAPRAVQDPRPEWAVSRNYEPLVPEPDDGVLDPAVPA